MKNIFLIIIATIAFIGVSVFAYKNWESKNYYQELAVQATSDAGGWKDKYNAAQVQIVDKITEIEVYDRKLNDEINKKRVKEIIYVEVTRTVEGKGKLEAVTNGTSDTPIHFIYKDFRLIADIDMMNLTLNYIFKQKLKVNIYQSENNDYRTEVLEINAETGEIVGTFEVENFLVIKEREITKQFNTGFNLSLGGIIQTEDWCKFNPNVYITANFISYGVSHLDSDWRFIAIGLSAYGGILSPIAYRISNHIPFLSDLFIEPLVGISWKGHLTYGIGLSTTF